MNVFLQQAREMTRFHSEEEGGVKRAPNFPWQKDVEQVFRIYHLARYLWPKRSELTPKEGIPWEEWFERHTSMTLDEFARWSNEQGLRKKFRKISHAKHRLMVTEKENRIGRQK